MSVAYLPHCRVVRLRGLYIATTVSYVPICGNKANGYRYRFRLLFNGYWLLFNVYCLKVPGRRRVSRATAAPAC